MAKASNGTSEPRVKAPRPKPEPVRPEDVRVNLRTDGKGSEGVFPGPRQTEGILRQHRRPKT